MTWCCLIFSFIAIIKCHLQLNFIMWSDHQMWIITWKVTTFFDYMFKRLLCGRNIMLMPCLSSSWVLIHSSLEAVMHFRHWWMHSSRSFPGTASSTIIPLSPLLLTAICIPLRWPSCFRRANNQQETIHEDYDCCGSTVVLLSTRYSVPWQTK
jgi:hypothetical protein